MYVYLYIYYVYVSIILHVDMYVLYMRRIWNGALFSEKISISSIVFQVLFFLKMYFWQIIRIQLIKSLYVFVYII